MGRMKELYIDIMNRYGEIPIDLDIVEYKRKKDIENAQWKEHEEKDERAQRKEDSNNDERMDDNNSVH